MSKFQNPQESFSSTSTVLTGNWKSMILPFIGILLINTTLMIFIGSFILMKLFGGNFETRDEGILFLFILSALVLCAWLFTYLLYFPKKWKTKVDIDLEKQRIVVQSPNGEQEYNFSTIDNIRYKAATSLFSTSYLYFISTSGEKEAPMIALSDVTMSTALFQFLKQRAKLNLVQ